MFPWKIIPHPNLIFILHCIFLNHFLAPLPVLKKIVLLHQLPKNSSYFLITFYSKPFCVENFPKTYLSSVSVPLQGFSDASYNLDYIVCLQVCLYHLQSSQDTISISLTGFQLFSQLSYFPFPSLSLLCLLIPLYKYLIIFLKDQINSEQSQEVSSMSSLLVIIYVFTGVNVSYKLCFERRD